MKRTAKQATGDFYEKLACEFLITHQCQIICTNYAAPNVGEIDIIARYDKQLPTGRHYPTLLCVEVRARRHSRFASAAETITKAKQKRLIATMSHFLQQNAQYVNFDVRFDVVVFDFNQNQTNYEWLQGAFLANDVV